MSSRQAIRNALNSNPNLKDAVYAKTDDICWYCGEHFNDWVFLPTIDHILDLAHGGTNSLDNLVPCCKICNSIKGDRGVRYLRARLACIRIMAEYEAGYEPSEPDTFIYRFYGEGWDR